MQDPPAATDEKVKKGFDDHIAITKQIIFENSRDSKIKEVAAHLHSHIADSGYMKASLEYPGYFADWFRDSSMVLICMLNSINHLKKYFFKEYEIEIETMKKDSVKILNMLWRAIEFFSLNIDRGIESNPRDTGFGEAKRHVLARFGEDKDGKVTYFSDPKTGAEIDKPEITHEKETSWLTQFDSVPLLLIGTKLYVETFNFESLGDLTQKIKKQLPRITDYMLNCFGAPCSNAWEVGGSDIHSYSVSALYGGVKAADQISKKIGLDLQNLLIKKPLFVDYEKDFSNFILKTFTRKQNDIPILCKSATLKTRDRLDSAVPVEGIDAAEYYIFTLFKPPLLNGEGLEQNTVNAIEKELFDGNVLPIRFRFFAKNHPRKDTYFFGGRWFLLGLEAASYYIETDRLDKAKIIIDYIEKDKIRADGAIAEQEMVDPESPDYDPSNYLGKNGGKPISCLAWSEAAYLAAVSSYREHLYYDKTIEKAAYKNL